MPMEEITEEKESPYHDWAARTHPWDQMYARRAFTSFQDDCSLDDYPVEVNLVEHHEVPEMWCEFEARPVGDMVKDFFDEHRVLHLGKNAHYWILWSVTQGNWRMNKKRTMFRFMGDDPTILKLRAFGDHWDAVESGKLGFCPNLVAITDTCNFLYGALLEKFNRLDKPGKAFQTRLENFRELPEFVPVQRNRDVCHKKHRWKHGQKSPGGEQPDLPAQPSVPHKINSVHFMLREYHEWLPKVYKARPG